MIDGWRTVSIALVIVCHIAQFSRIHLPQTRLGPLWPVAASLGLLGVQIFFVISGFVICRGMMLEEDTQGRVSLKAFYVRRLLRIVPPLALYTVVILVLVRLGIVESQAGLAWRTLTFTCNWPGVNCGSYLGGHTWSLSVEEQFYIIAPALFVISSAARRSGSLSLLAGLVAVVVALTLSGRAVPASFLANFIPIVVGVNCAVHKAVIRRIAQRLPSLMVPVLMVFLIVLGRLELSRLWLPANIATAIVIAVLLITTTFCDGVWSRLLAAPVMVAVGKVSYGVYLWQQLATYSFPGAGSLFYLVSITGCIALPSCRSAFSKDHSSGSATAGQTISNRPRPAGGRLRHTTL